MKRIFLLAGLTFFMTCKESEKVNTDNKTSTIYTISFNNAVHHEASVVATFTNIKNNVAAFRMARTSPGRYALHEFVKNVYNVTVTDAAGNALETSRPDPYSWHVKGHDGTIKVSYTLFANHGDGTYSQIDETHAHLNIPATFMYVPELTEDAIEVTFNTRDDLNWKVATQLKHENGNTYSAPNFQYFMDSPTEISNHSVRSFDVEGQTINFVLHHNGTEAELDDYFESVKKIVLQQKAVFDELPDFDFNNYYFLACYLPNATGDGMEHRNSTILTSTRSLSDGGMKRNLGTVSHEFIHAWNVERIRPRSLEPFDFTQADMSGELWFAEGFTSYYTELILARAELISEAEYINSLTRTINTVWNSTGRNFFNPIEMSYQAPFVDDATSIDPNNRDNTFISYYTYGSALGLALDLSLREQGLNLDDYMKLVWNTFGKNEKPYEISDLHNTLNVYAGTDFGDHFFSNYIYNSKMPDMKQLFENVGVALNQNSESAYFGASVKEGKISSNSKIGYSAYNAGLEKGDTIIQVGTYSLSDALDFDTIISKFKPGDTAKVIYSRFGNTKETTVTFSKDPSYTLELIEEATNEQNERRTTWLAKKQ